MGGMADGWRCARLHSRELSRRVSKSTPIADAVVRTVHFSWTEVGMRGARQAQLAELPEVRRGALGIATAAAAETTERQANCVLRRPVLCTPNLDNG